MSTETDDLWLECKTPGENARLYYINKTTGKVSWTKPSSSNIQSTTPAKEKRSSGEEKTTKSNQKSKLRWGALRGVVKGESDGVSKSNEVIKNLLAKARRNSGVTSDADVNDNKNTTAPTQSVATPSPRKKSLLSFSLNKSKYQEALARARKLADSITPAKGTETKDVNILLDENDEVNEPEQELSDDVKAIMNSGAKQLKRAKRVLTEWKKKTIGRWFKKWQINSVYILAETQQRLMEDKLKQSENKIKLNNAKSELALARMEVDAWRRAKKEKDTLVRKMATKSLQKVKSKLSNQIKWGFDKWMKFMNIHRSEEVSKVQKEVKKKTRDLNAYKAAIKEEKKRRRAAEKNAKELQVLLDQAKAKVTAYEQNNTSTKSLSSSSSGGNSDDRDTKNVAKTTTYDNNSNSQLRKVSSVSSNTSSIDDSSLAGNDVDVLYSQIEQLETEKKELEDALQKANSNTVKNNSNNTDTTNGKDLRKLQNENNRLKLQVERLTQECNRLIAEQKVKIQEFNRKLKGANIVSLEKYEELKVMADHYKSLSDEREEQFKQLAEEHTTERNKWMARFSMQQDTIEGLENDVEELSELKVLELAENYYVSQQNGYA
jgi:hypothetical protein